MVLGGCVALVGCSGNVRNGGSGTRAGDSAGAGDNAGGGSDGAGPPPEMAGIPDTAPAPRRPGWSIRDATPYSRTAHATVFDEARDRMIIVGGGAAIDVWALPLSGRDQNRWAQILPEGESPPADAELSVSAVYDPIGQRLLVLRADSLQFTTPRIWELTRQRRSESA